MEINKNQYQKIERILPKQIGNVKIDNRNMLEEGLQYATEYALDSTSVKVYPGAFGCSKKR
ncbi:MAG: hypothetical protein FWC06_05755 [Treponema sp.]|nr:hypothetical protein [Treponema sp.]